MQSRYLVAIVLLLAVALGSCAGPEQESVNNTLRESQGTTGETPKGYVEADEPDTPQVSAEAESPELPEEDAQVVLEQKDAADESSEEPSQRVEKSNNIPAARDVEEQTDDAPARQMNKWDDDAIRVVVLLVDVEAAVEVTYTLLGGDRDGYEALPWPLPTHEYRVLELAAERVAYVQHAVRASRAVDTLAMRYSLTDLPPLANELDTNLGATFGFLLQVLGASDRADAKPEWKGQAAIDHSVLKMRLMLRSVVASEDAVGHRLSKRDGWQVVVELHRIASSERELCHLLYCDGGSDDVPEWQWAASEYETRLAQGWLSRSSAWSNLTMDHTLCQSNVWRAIRVLDREWREWLTPIRAAIEHGYFEVDDEAWGIHGYDPRVPRDALALAGDSVVRCLLDPWSSKQPAS